MLTPSTRRMLLLGLMLLISLYLALPLAASYLLGKGLRDSGYKNVIIQLGYPGLRGMRIPVASFRQELPHETVMVSLTDVELQYRPWRLLHGHVDRVVLPDVAVQILNTMPAGVHTETGLGQEDGSPWELLTAGDLLRRLPILPFDELRMARMTIFREQATGPLRRVTVSGVLVQQGGELGGHLTFQGQDTASYDLTVAGHSASNWSATLTSQRPQATPIVSWQSYAHPRGSQIQMEGRLEVNVRGLAPFIALLVPIGPELGRVTGQIAMSWTGTTAADATLPSIWEDPRTQVDGQVRGAMTLPALQGVAKDIALAWEGTFRGATTQVAWTVRPGVLLTATVNAQPRLIPEIVRTMLPSGDQPVRIEQTEPIQGQLFWADSSPHLTVEGPLRVVYGRAPGPLVLELQTTRAEAVGQELVGMKGSFRVEGQLSKIVTDRLSAKEAMGGFHGNLVLDGSELHLKILPSSFVTVRQIERTAVSIPRVTVQLSELLPVRCEWPVGRCRARAASLSIRLPAARVMGREIRPLHSTVQLQQAETVGSFWSVEAALRANGVTMSLSEGAMAATNWQVKLTANEAGLKADVRADTLLQEGLFTARIVQPFSAAPASMHGRLGPVVFDGDKHRLSRMITGRTIPLDITEGQFTATIEAAWALTSTDPQQPVRLTSGTATVTAESLSGHFGPSHLKGVTTALTLRADDVDSMVMVEPALLRVNAIQTGVELSDVTVMLQAAWRWAESWPVLELKNLRGNLFGGKATSPGVRLDWSQPSRRMTVVLREVDLAKILSAAQKKGLHGTGLLNGTLPVNITSSGVTVEDGVVEAQAPGGVIRYAGQEPSKVITETDSQAQLAVQALTNLHYTVLRARAQYTETGTLDLSVRLEGSNPDLTESPPVHFNLTVQEHVPTLLKHRRVFKDQDATHKLLRPL